MCGRFALEDDGTAVQEQFQLDEKPFVAARYNIAPSQPVAAVGHKKDGRRGLTHFQWGLIPSWAKDPSIGNKMINARAETAAEKPSFRAAFKRRRCLIPMSGFYEWQKRPDGKQPHYIHPQDDHALFAAAGLWERWMGDDGTELQTCTILTTQPNDFMRDLHNRMPVFIQPADYDTWLSRDTHPDDLQPLLHPYPPDRMAAYPVSTHVNRPGNDDPACIQPLTA